MQTRLTNNIEYDSDLNAWFDEDNDAYISYQMALDGIRKKSVKLRKEKLMKITFTGLTFTGLSNSEIVLDVFLNYNILQLIKKMIDFSTKDQSCYDLEQYIYEKLLIMDNTKLNSMYFDGENSSKPNKKSTKLRNYISQMIKNSRNGGVNGNNTEYQVYFRIKDNNQHYDNGVFIDIADTVSSEEEISITSIMNYIDTKSVMNDYQKYTSDELKSILAFTLLKKYFMSDLTQNALAIHLNMSRLTISKLLKFAKEDILLWWTKVGKFQDENKYKL